MNVVMDKKRVGIFGNDMRKVNRVFDNIIGRMLYKDVKNVSKMHGASHFAELADGTTYRTFHADNLCVGFRFTHAVIEVGTSEDFIKGVILPSLISQPDGSDPVVEYFD